MKPRAAFLLGCLVCGLLAWPAEGARILKDTGAPRLAESGEIDPARVYFSQDSIKGEFKDNKLENPSIAAFRDRLKAGKVTAAAVPPIRILWYPDWRRWVSVDNRRLWAFKAARMKAIHYRKATQTEIDDAQKLRKFSSHNQGESIDVRGETP